MLASLDPTYPLFPILSFIGFVLCLIPLPWHLQAWNSGTCAFMIWTSLACLVEFVNCILWTGNVKNDIPVWCDISSKFLLGAGVGITASTLCISRRLYHISTTKNTSISQADKRRALVIDICIAVGVPFLVMALHYVVQPHRYNILEDIGCYPAIYNTLPAYFLVYMWPVLLGSISFVYSALTFRSFWMRRLQFAQLVASNSSLSFSRYIRLMMLALTDMVLTVPLGVFSIVLGTRGVTLAPWISWEDTHFNFSRVELIPALIWRSNPSFQASVELTRWLYVGSAFVFFGLFGFAGEAQKHYRLLFRICAKPFGLYQSSAKSKSKPQLSQLSSFSWKKPQDSESTDIKSPSNSLQLPLSAKASKLSLGSSSVTTVRVDVDIEKFADMPSPSTETASQYTYPPSPSYTISSPSHSRSLSDPHLPISHS